MARAFFLMTWMWQSWLFSIVLHIPTTLVMLRNLLLDIGNQITAFFDKKKTRINLLSLLYGYDPWHVTNDHEERQVHRFPRIVPLFRFLYSSTSSKCTVVFLKALVGSERNQLIPLLHYGIDGLGILLYLSPVSDHLLTHFFCLSVKRD